MNEVALWCEISGITRFDCRPAPRSETVGGGAKIRACIEAGLKDGREKEVSPYPSEFKRRSINLVRVKGLEPPRHRRQNLNYTNTKAFQSLGVQISQDISETKRESAKLANIDLTKENPATSAKVNGASGAEEGIDTVVHDTAYLAARHPIIALHWGFAA